MRVGKVVTETLVCDMCGQDGSVQEWRVTRVANNRSVRVDLCETHGKPLEDIKALFPPGKRKPRIVYKTIEEAPKAPTARRPARKKPAK